MGEANEMNAEDAAVQARREVYRLVSWVILAVTLLVLAVVALGLPLFYTPRCERIYRCEIIYKAMNGAMPIISQYAIGFSTPVICLLMTGLVGVLLVVKEILAAPKVRFWINVVTLLILLIWGACYVCAISLPMWGMSQKMQGS